MLVCRAARRGEELIAAGLLMLAGHVDLDELDRWMRIGWGVAAARQSHTAKPASNSLWRGPTAVSSRMVLARGFRQTD
jgi:hypothetical protein